MNPASDAYHAVTINHLGLGMDFWDSAIRIRLQGNSMDYLYSMVAAMVSYRILIWYPMNRFCYEISLGAIYIYILKILCGWCFLDVPTKSLIYDQGFHPRDRHMPSGLRLSRLREEAQKLQQQRGDMQPGSPLHPGTGSPLQLGDELWPKWFFNQICNGGI